MDELVAALDETIIDHERRQSIRYVEELRLRKAKEYMKVKEWRKALDILLPLWQTMTYRKEGWWDVVEDICLSLRTVASHVGDGGAFVSASWELMNQTFSMKDVDQHNLSDALTSFDMASKPSITLREQDIHSFLSSTFAFERAESKVADTCKCQLNITSYASKLSQPINFSAIRLDFDGGLKPIIVKHSSGESSTFAVVELSDADTLTGHHDLSIAPGQTRVLQFSFPLREAGEVRASTATFSLLSDAFDLNYVVGFEQLVPDMWWYSGTSRRRVVRLDPYILNILPKPPKMDLKFIELHEQYYTSEVISLQLQITNAEEEDSAGKLHVYFENDKGPLISLSLAAGDAINRDEPQPSIDIGTVSKGQSTLVDVQIPASELPSAYDLIIDSSYHLKSDPKSTITKTMSTRLFIVSPFEANYEFSPRLDLAPWPSFFNHSESPETPSTAAGIIQRWNLTCLYASFAVTPLQVTKIEVVPLMVIGGISFNIVGSHPLMPSEDQALEMNPSASEEASFTIATQKFTLDDRRSAALDLAMSISWRRTSSSPSNTTLLPVPRLQVASQEPRVLLSYEMHPSSTLATPVLTLSYTIENPSMHFLTFAVSMSPSEEFAFSGDKTGTLQLVPLSRRTIRFVILPMERSRGTWIRPILVVRDRYFQKVLKVSPGDGCRSDKEGVTIWVPAGEDV